MAEKKDFPKKEKAEGLYKPTGEQVRFNREWSGHRFTDQEVDKLLDGQEISFDATNRNGRPYVAQGSLQEQEYNGNTFWGFKLNTDAVPLSWAGHTFTEEELQILRDGGSVYVQDCVSAKTGKQFACNVTFGEEEGRKRIIPHFDND